MEYWNAVIQRLDLQAKGAWFVYSTGAILSIVSILFMKRMSWREAYTTMGVVGFLAWMGDIVFFFQLDLLDSGNPSIGGIPDVFMFAIVPVAISILYINLLSKSNRWLLSGLFTGASLLLEYISVKVGFLIQKNWYTWYSIPFYWIYFAVFLPWHINYIRHIKTSSPFTGKQRILEIRTFRREKAK